MRNAKSGFEDGNYSVPAGHLDGGETVRGAAIREALEEVGVQIDLGAIDFATVMHRKSDHILLPVSNTDERVDFFVRIQKWAGEPFNAEPEKCDELRWCDVDNLPVNTISYVRRAVGNYLEGKPFDEFGWER
jgi:8-oxo-dGTP pyrophosphatase MutT (NUDIX family)